MKFVLAIPLILHGLANLGGVAAFLLGANNGFNDRPWLFSAGITRRSAAARLFGLVWLLSTIALVASGAGLILGQAWWWAMAIAGSALSLLAIAPWWNTVVPGARFAAIFDIAMLVFLLSPWGRSFPG